jgi:hypothetical protein
MQEFNKLVNTNNDQLEIFFCLKIFDILEAWRVEAAEGR